MESKTFAASNKVKSCKKRGTLVYSSVSQPGGRKDIV